MEELFNYMQSIHPLSDQITLHLQTLIKEKRIFRNEIVLKAGQTARYIYFIKSGILRGYYMKDGEEVSAWFMTEGNFVISVSSFYTQQPGDESIQALAGSELFFLSYEDLRSAYERFPELNFVGRVITERYYIRCENRIKSMRMLSARERYDQLFQNQRELIGRVPAKYLASYLGVTEVTFSRSRFKK